MLFAEGFQAGRADFLFSFEDKLDVIFQQFVLDEIFEGFDLDKGLSFVIIRSACPDVSVPYFGFELQAAEASPDPLVRDKIS